MSSPSYTRFGVLRPKLLLRAALGCAVRTSAVALLPRRNGKAKTVGGFLFALDPSLALEAFAREVTLEESESILKKITAVQKRVLAAADRARTTRNASAHYAPSALIWPNRSTVLSPISFSKTFHASWTT